MADEDDGWEILTGPPQFNSVPEKKLHGFLKAVQLGNLEKMKDMLNKKEILDVNESSPQKNETAIHYACKSDKIAAVKLLVEYGADVNLKDFRGKHGLHLASSFGYLPLVKYLITQGANLNFVDKYGRSCLHWASVNKHFEVVQALINAGAPVHYPISNNWQPLHEAAKGGDLRIVKFLVEKNAVVNSNVKGGNSTFTPLHIAAREGHTDCLKYLLTCKANVNAVNQGLQTPLHEAAFRGSKDCCRELLIHGADPHAKNNLQRTPLLEACNQGNLQCAIYCLDAGSFVNFSNRIHDTPLHHLLKAHGRFPLDEPAPLNDNRMSLERLVAFTDVLLQYGSNPNLSNDDYETGFTIANSMMDKSVVDVIFSSLDKPLSLLHIAKIKCRKIMQCNYPLIKELPIPKTLQAYLVQNSSYYSGW